MERDALFLEPMVYSFISLRVPTEGALPRNRVETYGHRPQSGQKAYIRGVAWFPRGSFTTMQLLPQCHAAFSTIPFTLAWVDQSPVRQGVS